MTTDANLVGKGDFSQNIEGTASTAPQTVNSEPQAVSNSEQAAPSAEPPFTLIDPLPEATSNVIREDRPEMPLTYQLPFFFTWQVRNQEQVCKLLGAIDTIFYEFNRSRRAKETIDEDSNINQMLAYRMLQISFEDIVHQGAAQRIDGYKKPSAKEYLKFETPNLATGDSEPDTNPALANNPASCADITTLQQWVSDLQKMCLLELKINGGLEGLNVAQGELINEQAGSIKNLNRQIEILEQFNKEQEAKRVRYDLDRKVPDAHHYIDLTLYLIGGQESEVELVREIVADASESKLEEMLKLIVNNDSDEAFLKYEEYKKLQEVLAKISTQLTDVGYDSYLRAHYGNRPKEYVKSEEHDLKAYFSNKGKFIDKFCVFAGSEEEGAEEEEQPEVVADESTSAA